jgi:hypothetical protein
MMWGGRRGGFGGWGGYGRPMGGGWGGPWMMRRRMMGPRWGWGMGPGYGMGPGWGMGRGWGSGCGPGCFPFFVLGLLAPFALVFRLGLRTRSQPSRIR